MPPAQHSSTRNDKQRSRPAQTVRIAALLTGHPPKSRIKLATDPALSLHSELNFEPIPLVAGLAHAGAGFGLLHSGYLPRGLDFGRIPVKRGRWGSKPPEQLQLLQPLPDSLQAQPALKQRGVLRSIAQAYSDLRSASAPESPDSIPESTTLLLAVELALYGWVERSRLAAFASGRGEGLPSPGKQAEGPVRVCAGLLVWQGYAARMAGQLAGLLGQTKHCNPLRKDLSETQVASLLGLEQPGLAGAVLDEFAAQQQLAAARKTYPRSYRLSGSFSPPELTADDTACVRSVLETLSANPAASRRDFKQFHPGRQHVISWLYDSETLIELPGWYSITRERLERHLKHYPAGPGQRVPSVRDLKDGLKLQRREAESLRSWYLAQAAPPARDGQQVK